MHFWYPCWFFVGGRYFSTGFWTACDCWLQTSIWQIILKQNGDNSRIYIRLLFFQPVSIHLRIIFAVHQGSIRKSNMDHEDHPCFFSREIICPNLHFWGGSHRSFLLGACVCQPAKGLTQKTVAPGRFSSRSKTPHVESVSDHWHLSTVHRWLLEILYLDVPGR